MLRNELTEMSLMISFLAVADIVSTLHCKPLVYPQRSLHTVLFKANGFLYSTPEQSVYGSSQRFQGVNVPRVALNK